MSACLLWLVGCGSSPTQDGSLEKESETSQAIPEEEPLLRLFFWEEYIDLGLLEAFTEQTGIEVELKEYGTIDELEAHLQEDTSEHDLVIIDDSTLKNYKELKLIREINTAWIPNVKNIKSEFQHRPADPQNEYSIPYFWGVTLLVYNKEKIPVPPDSWNALWNPAYSGKVGMMEDPWDFSSLGAFRIGVTPDTVDPVEQTKAMEAFKTLIPHVGNFTEFDDMLTEVNAGNLWIGNSYNGDAATFARDHPNLGYVIPKEGAMSFCDNLVMPRRAKHPGNAHRFMNFMLEPEHAAKNANAMSFTPVVRDLDSLLNPELAEDPQLNPPPEVLARCRPYPLITYSMRQIHDEIFKSVNLRREEIWKKGDANLPD